MHLCHQQFLRSASEGSTRSDAAWPRSMQANRSALTLRHGLALLARPRVTATNHHALHTITRTYAQAWFAPCDYPVRQ
jgi:hypothetical protein